MLNMSNKERFLGVLGYAPSTIPAPQYKDAADVHLFKKEKGEKEFIKLAKAIHKNTLKKAYPSGIGRHLNIPSKELTKDGIMKWQF